ncbi:hypothetical protein L3X38_001808 [Prunus dulcis]|uniref:Retrotransposon gag domain-containing protein n=1 Tax=Prunus dulcis TaxID=3755 RepID=A0AAD4ZKK4_PRUDU|nr:hypothetical protein L3X38_001808 [Prunus dulcis]
MRKIRSKYREGQNDNLEKSQFSLLSLSPPSRRASDPRPFPSPQRPPQRTPIFGVDTNSSATPSPTRPDPLPPLHRPELAGNWRRTADFHLNFRPLVLLRFSTKSFELAIGETSRETSRESQIGHRRSWTPRGSGSAGLAVYRLVQLQILNSCVWARNVVVSVGGTRQSSRVRGQNPHPEPEDFPIPEPVQEPALSRTGQSRDPSPGYADQAKRIGATDFDGDGDPAVAEEWIKRMERIMEVMAVPQDRRVTLATFFLIRNARHWWESVRRRYRDPSAITWPVF